MRPYIDIQVRTIDSKYKRIDIELDGYDVWSEDLTENEQQELAADLRRVAEKLHPEEGA